MCLILAMTSSSLLGVPADERPSQLFPEAIDVSEPGCPQRGQLLVEVGGKRSRRRRFPLTADHRSDVAGRDAVAVAAAGPRGVVALAESGGRSIDQVEVQEDPAGPQVLANLPIDLADAREVSQVVQAAGRHGGVERSELFR